MLCWGNTSFGQLGLGGIDEEIVKEPRRCTFFAGSSGGRAAGLRAVACGRRHTLFLMEDATVYSCGCNDLGQLGHDKTRKKLEQVSSLDTQTILAVACGDSHTLALNDKGQLFAWGQASEGQLGLPGTDEIVRVPRHVKTLAEVPIVQVACGYHHSLALAKDGRLFTWGSNRYGQLGVGSFGGSQRTAQLVHTLQGVPLARLAAGKAHSLALTCSGAVFAWGRNNFGQLGLSDEIDKCYPALLKSLRTQKVVYICCGEDHTAILTKEGGVFTFGAGGYGQLGHNSTNHEVNPRKVFELMGSIVTQIACGRQHTLAFVPSSGRIYSFGLGGNGQLGTGSTSNRKSPFTVQGAWVPHNGPCPSNVEKEECCIVKRIFAGGDQSFAHYFPPEDSVEPDDFRLAEPHMQVCVLSGPLLEKWASLPSGRLPSDVVNEIDMIFSSPSCINGSFLAYGADEHYRTSGKVSGLDMNATRLAFNKLLQSPCTQVLQQMAASLEKTLIPQLSTAPPDVEAMRLYLVLPEFPLMHDERNFSTLAISFAMAITKLGPTPAKVLENWWSVLTPPFFLKLVELYKAVVVFLLKLHKMGVPPAEEPIFQASLRSALVVLQILHRANTRTSVIQYDKFYIGEICDLVDIRRDYIAWIQQQAYRVDVNSAMAEEVPVTLCSFPFVFDAQAKTTLLQTDAILQMQVAVDEATRRNFSSMFMPIDPENPCLVLMVRRDNIVGDTLEMLRKQAKNLDFKKPLKVIFYGEDAVDAGGVRKEFFLLIMKDLLDPKYGLFKYYEESRLIWFSQQTFEDSNLFNLIGLICGLAIYNSTIVDLNFPLALYKKLLKVEPTLEDLKELMPDVGRSLQQLLDYPDDDVEETFCLNFTVAFENFGAMEVKELVPGGSDMVVNNANRQDFVNAYVDYIFNKSVQQLFEAFHTGFHKVCGGKVLQLFQPSELMAMVIGNTDYDWAELEKNTEYKGEYWAGHPTIKSFWEVFHELDLELKKKFLLFLTGSDRIPILGMKSLKIVIQPTGGGEQFLPVAHTCFNLLDLPKFSGKAQLREKLLQSITHYQGFSLA
ncbi:putative E3 ubiquitin-protein ligase HERC4 isoform X1 [Petromyzon marinus]|uniref:Probable E3 ubiquitin-protein ligase HERC4 isoform X1 n=1 Tax=Petromyzon marinus TaxID=7757 RepID=A0AAJ7WQ35_PETMA|nr:probable E3 ubiquitin-protein ligase HERC4 isoform X1 [Petromyzon marinus]XP_032805643.1 probable E3 ubiquitin-protein ligase HERC4 isoform X1 [Petromyzon marinus]